MLLLASVLGEVKPPVASKEDVHAAGGVSIVGEDIHPLEGDRCLVCLSDYDPGEQCRTLSGCGHIFHKDCIDEVPRISVPTNKSGSYLAETRVPFVVESV